METLAVLAILIVLAIPISLIVLFVMVAGLKARVAGLEARLAQTLPAAKQPIPAEQEAAPTQTTPQPAPQSAPQPRDPVAVVSPWERLPDIAAAPLPPPLPPQTADQNRPLVLRADRLADLGQWLRSNWVYVVSAASLGLAGIFFVQYGMERGLLPPGLRVIAALVFGAGLVAVGEVLRRRHGDEGASSFANLPSVFSGAGVVTLFAAILAARQLYGLIGPTPAFAGLLATAALAVAIGWFSGPLLVAVGLVGAFAAPFVVGGGADSVDWLYGYFAIVVAVGLAVDAVRRWAWVSVLALALGYLAGLLLQLGGGGDLAWAAQLLALVLLATILPELRLIPAQTGPAALPALWAKGADGWPPFPVRLVLGAMLTSCLGLFFLSDTAPQTALMALASLTALALAFLIWADRAEGLADIALWPALAFLAALALQGADHGQIWQDFSAAAQRPPETAAPLTAGLLLAMATLISLAAAFRALRPGPWGLPFAAGAALTAPMAALVLEVWWQPAAVMGRYPWALHVIALAALMTGFALRLARADAPDLRRAAHATLSALSLIALALFVLTTKTALTLALAVLVVAAAALDRRFRLPEMGLFVQAGAALLGYRLLVDPGLAWALDAPLGPVLTAFGATIAAMVAVLWLIRPLDRRGAQAVAESAAAGLAAILANVLLTRWLDSPETARLFSHWGLTLNALPWVIFALMQLWRARAGGPLAKLRQGLAGLGGVMATLGLGSAATTGNPLFSWGPEQAEALVRGALVLDTLLLAYGLPALILALALWKMPELPRLLRIAVGAGIGLMATLYSGLEIRRFWQGDWLGAPGVVQGELYSYTVALMLLGAGLLYLAISRRSDGLRRAAMAVIALVVAKVFFIDAAGLTGLTRVVSFAGLGLSLAGLAWLNRWADRAGATLAEKPGEKS